MNISNADQPAYPTDNARQTGHNEYHSEGLTKREDFAKAIMPALIMLHDHDQTPGDIAADAVFYADALLAALKEVQP